MSLGAPWLVCPVAKLGPGDLVDGLASRIRTHNVPAVLESTRSELMTVPVRNLGGAALVLDGCAGYRVPVEGLSSTTARALLQFSSRRKSLHLTRRGVWGGRPPAKSPAGAIFG